MKIKPSPFQVIAFPRERRNMPAINDLNARKHFMYGLLEVDVTMARQFIENVRLQTGELLSFTGFLAFCMAQAVEENKGVQAYMKGRKHLVLFEHVDVGLMVERKVGENHILTGHVIREANRKTFREIHREIRAIQAEPVTPNAGTPAWLSAALQLPWPFSSWFNTLFRLALRYNPQRFVSLVGTVGITSVGMFGKGHSGWGIGPLTHGLGLLVGSTIWKPVVVDGRIEPREILNLTITFDHDVMDGAPAARFTNRLVELIESGYGLNEEIPNEKHS